MHVVVIFDRRELRSRNSEAIVVVIDVSNVMLIAINAIFFIDLKIHQEMVIVVTEDVINCFVSCSERAVEFDVLAVYNGFQCVLIHIQNTSF